MNHHEAQSMYPYIRGLLLIGFGMLLFKLLVTGHIQNFIAPTMHVFTYFTVVAVFSLGIFQIWNVPKPVSSCDCCQHKKEDTKLRGTLLSLLFLLPIVSGFLFSNVALDGDVALKRGVTLSGVAAPSQTEGGDSEIGSLLADAEEDVQQAPPAAPPGYYEQLEKTLLGTQHIVVRDDDYISVMDVIGKDVSGFKGKKITFIGFVHREPDLDENTMILARYGITCCTADASVLGMMVKGKEASSLQQGDWVEVTGTIGETVYIDTLLPLITIQSVEKISPPKTPYVYQKFS